MLGEHWSLVYRRFDQRSRVDLRKRGLHEEIQINYATPGREGEGAECQGRRGVRQLEEDGFIVAYRAMLDRNALGCGFQVFVGVVLCREDRAAIEEFEHRLADLPEVLEAYRPAANTTTSCASVSPM